MATRKRPSRPPVPDAEYSAALQRVRLLHVTMPTEARKIFAKMNEQICDMGDAQQIAPEQMAVFVATLIGGLALAHVAGNVHADQEIDLFLDHCKIAMDVAVAAMRIEQGWQPAGRN